MSKTPATAPLTVSASGQGRTGVPLAITVLVGGLPVSAELPPETIEVLRLALAPSARPAGASPYLSADEAAEILRCRRRRVYELVADGRLARHGDGRRLLVRRADVERLADGR